MLAIASATTTPYPEHEPKYYKTLAEAAEGKLVVAHLVTHLIDLGV